MNYKEDIYKVLEKRHETVKFDLYLFDYDGTDVYIGLVYNPRIKKFKVLSVPINAINEGDKVEEYFCYQFIFSNYATYIMKLMSDNRPHFQTLRERNRAVPSNYTDYIEISYHNDKEDYDFNFTEFIDEDYSFMFDIIVALFEHAPNILSELCPMLLRQFNNPLKLFKFNEVAEFELIYSDYSELFEDEVIKRNKYSEKDIQFLDIVDGNYWGMINNNRFIISEDLDEGVIKLYTENVIPPVGDEVYALIKQIRKDKLKPFNKIEYIVKEPVEGIINLYAYDIDLDSREILLFQNLRDEKITLGMIDKGLLTVLRATPEFKEKIHKYLTDKYIASKAKKLEKELYERKDEK